VEQNFRGQTVTSPPEIKAPENDAFNMFGDLLLRTRRFPSGAIIDEIRYRDVYVDAAGLEEITRDLAQVKEHKRGTIRVPLTDIRKWHQNMGPLFGKMNWKFRAARAHPGTDVPMDPDTLKDGEKTPWTLTEVLAHYYKLLPGTPRIVNLDELEQAKLENPYNLRGEGEPVIQHIQRLLDRYGLKTGMRPDNNWVVYKRLDPKFKAQGDLPGPNGNVVRNVPFQHYERITSRLSDRPPAILVVGPKKIRRKTQSYIPVLQDVDHRWYRLGDLMIIWGYDIEKVKKGAIIGHEKFFQDVPPIPNSGENARLHEARKRILERAFRIYAPRSPFKEPPLTGSTIDSETRKRVSLRDEDFARNAYLPLSDHAWYIGELELSHIEIPDDRIKQRGDKEEFYILPPLVRANRVGQQLYTSGKGPKAYETYFDGLKEETERFIEQRQEMITDLERDIRNKADSLNNTEAAFINTFRTGLLTRQYLSNRGLSTTLIRLDEDTRQAIKEAGTFPPTDLVQDLMTVESFALKRELDIDAQIVKQWKDEVQEAEQKVAAWAGEFKAFDEIYKKRKTVRCWYNLPHGQLEDGTFTINRRTGILTSSEPLAHIEKQFFFDGDEAVVETDGHVTVTAGYELQENTIKAWTNFLFVSSEPAADDEIAEPLLAGVCRTSPIKAFIVPMEGRIYELDEGTPVNLNGTYIEAFAKAAEKLAVPRTITGHTYEFTGFRNFPLDAGVTTVQHTYDGALARTHVSINAPGSRGPLGPGNLAGRKGGRADVATVDYRERRDRDRELPSEPRTD